ncbi:Piso0_005006 [Millerozyma farinosa CBS 7064]|uniref:Piso0_005006 protein n=1 Tax=Pichia sorbitophila (strain ATCC MYA-4447 / BCRC 22081 / CBS 7064 / NBRC 10061 / NRRL Y-12695) TaxID=559304 RepID=G8Y3Z2_PICSO|nr:Piso0_005006 [Millerozyma farinosa CBS 7064]
MKSEDIRDILEIVKFGIEINGGEETFVDVLGADKIELKIPESSKYVSILYFRVNKPIKGFKYKQVVKKHGLTVKSREIDIGDYEPSDELYSKAFPEDDTPGGFLVRGVYPATSTYYVNGEEVSDEWTLEIVKKK